MDFADELRPFHLATNTNPDDAFTDETEAVGGDMYPDESSSSLEDDHYPDDDEYESDEDDDVVVKDENEDDL